VAKSKFTAPKGMRDIMPDEAALFRHVEETFRETCRLFGYREIRTPHLEATDLFCRTVGETTDIVEKEMYTLTTKGGDDLALRPENTAGVVRAYLEHGMHRSAPLQKFFYWGEMFRHEAKQKKRYREFTQAGVELLGSEYPEADVEVFSLAVEFFRKLGLGDVRAELNTFGCPECRPDFREALLAYFKEREEKLCRDCKRRLGRNVFRLMDCKEQTCRDIMSGAPTIAEFLDDFCKSHLEIVESDLRDMDVPLTMNPRLVRGLDYYTRTIFEIFPAEGQGRQDALGAGGRYDGLAEFLAGPQVPAVGFALGVDRIALAVSEGSFPPAADEAPSVYVACLPAPEEQSAATWRSNLQKAASVLRREGVPCIADLGRKKLNRQLSDAAKSGARLVVLVGGTENVENKITLKDLAAKEQWNVPARSLANEVRRFLDQNHVEETGT